MILATNQKFFCTKRSKTNQNFELANRWYLGTGYWGLNTGFML